MLGLCLPLLYSDLSLLSLAIIMHSSISEHDVAKVCSKTLLQKAHDMAAKKDNYDSEKTQCDCRYSFLRGLDLGQNLINGS